VLFSREDAFRRKGHWGTIARKLSTVAPKVEFDRLRGENGVMQKRSVDMVENQPVSVSTKIADGCRRKHAGDNGQMQRRREIFGEAIYLLQKQRSSQRPRNGGITASPAMKFRIGLDRL
jgi:hypothetical protein